ncbi:hypothetical protein BGW38_009305, partial [Lunasporangiospora selenospora]
MKLILAPLLALAMFAAVASADAQDLWDDMVQDSTFLSNSMSEDALKGTVYAYWPDKKDSDPDTRIINIKGESFKAIYKDPKDNEYDLSSADDYERYRENQKLRKHNPGEDSANSAEEPTIYTSVLLDKDGNVVHQVFGTNVPKDSREVKMYLEQYLKNLIAQLDPNTPGIEDIKDPAMAMAQIILNSIAEAGGPDALEMAKKNPDIIKVMDEAYASSKVYEQELKKLDEMIAKEDADANADAFTNPLQEE